ESVHLPARTAFAPEPRGRRPFHGELIDTPELSVQAAHLDHRIPCLGFAVAEKTRLNVRPERLAELGVPPGRWLNQLKDAVRSGQPDDTPIRVEWRDGGVSHSATFTLAELRERLLVETRGQKIAYVVDTLFSRENLARISQLARGADVFFCESL